MSAEEDLCMMDPAGAAGLALGVVTLAFDVFDRSVRREFCRCSESVPSC